MAKVRCQRVRFERALLRSGRNVDTSSPNGSRLGTLQVHLLTLLFSVNGQNSGSRRNHSYVGPKPVLSQPESLLQCTPNSVLNRWLKGVLIGADWVSYWRVNSGGNNVGFTGPEATWIAPALPRRSNLGSHGRWTSVQYPDQTFFWLLHRVVGSHSKRRDSATQSRYVGGHLNRVLCEPFGGD